MQKKLHPLLLSLFSGLLLSAGWHSLSGILIFFALVPLLLAQHRLSIQGEKNTLKIFGLAYVCFLTWNLLVTWWVVYASLGGACMAFIFNSLFMAMVFTIWVVIKNKLNKRWTNWLLIPMWLAWEHGHTLWDLTWTWLTLGNAFAFNHNWVQWYEFTGTSGGSAWVLAVNVLVFQTIVQNNSLKLSSAPILRIAACIVLPVLLSYSLVFLQSGKSTNNGCVNTMVVQPNIDPYNDKFNWDFNFQFNKALRLIEGKIDNSTDYLVFPETFITENLNEENINEAAVIQWFRDSLLRKFPRLTVVTGANTYVVYKNGENSATARKDERGFYYDIYNTALQITASGVQIYHKSKLVPGVEKMPFPALLKPLENLAINMGGTMGSLGTQAERGVFYAGETCGATIAPVICYESIFSDYTTAYRRKGANTIFIITNDGWWDDSPGYKQHLQYARLRAIENRCEIARCANTGISCFVDQYGNLSQETAWWQEAVITKSLSKNDRLTFFARFGDLLAYTSVCISLLLILWYIAQRINVVKN